MTEQETTRFPNIAGLSPASSKLIEKLKSGNPDDVLTDEDMTAICGRDTSVGGDGYPNLQRAIQHCERVYGIVWMRIKGAGAIKYLDGHEILEDSQSNLRRTRKRSVRSVRKLASVSNGQIDPDEQARHRALTAQWGTLAMFSKPDTTKKLEARGISEPVDPKRLLESLGTT